MTEERKKKKAAEKCKAQLKTEQKKKEKKKATENMLAARLNPPKCKSEYQLLQNVFTGPILLPSEKNNKVLPSGAPPTALCTAEHTKV